MGGGLVGLNEGAISQSYASASVNAGMAGGLVGLNDTNGIDTGTIANSYATGNVSGGQSGGFVSYAVGGEISASYSMGAVPSGQGGFLCDGGEVSADYWDTTTSGTMDGDCDGNISDVTGLTTKQLKRRLPAGFDKKIWAENPKINNGLPYLIANPPAK